MSRTTTAAPAAWVSITLISLAGAALTLVVWNDLATGDAISNLGAAPAAVVYATLGLLVVRHARSIIGWMLLGEGAGLAILGFASAYAILGITRPGAVPAPELVGLLAEWMFVPAVAVLGFMLLVFPSGRLPSRRWRPFAALGLLATALYMIGFVVQPRLVALPAPGGVSLMFPNPLGTRSLGTFLSAVPVGTLNSLSALLIGLVAASVLSMAIRYRSGTREVRQQIKWVASTAVLALACSLVALVAIAADLGTLSVVPVTAYAVMSFIALFGIPAAITLAILKHKLFEIDVIISRTVTYGLLSAALTAVYAAIVIGIGTLAGYAGGPLLTAAAAVVIAVLFQPLRRRAQQAANRVVYGQRATPYQVLGDFARNMAGQLDADMALDRMASVLAAATGAIQVDVWIRVGEELRPRVTFPRVSAPHAPVPLTGETKLPLLDAATRAIAVRHGNELLGAITIQKPRNEPVSAVEDKLLENLASQAGLVLRNVRLTAELQATIEDLQASRRRLVHAQDEERQRIERNLHDGAQQQLVALIVLLSLIEDAADDPGEVTELSGQLNAGLRAALDDLRALAHGIYPPLLADSGLEPALRAQADRAPLPVLVEAEGVGRYPRDAEAAVYFCILEALQNVVKYARATQATVSLSSLSGYLRFSVTDNGVGFDIASAGRGTGLQGMADRLAAVGGTLSVQSAPGRGTTVSGTLPASELSDAKALMAF